MPEAAAPKEVETEPPPPIPEAEPSCTLLLDEHAEPACTLLLDEHAEPACIVLLDEPAEEPSCACCTHFAVDFDRMPELLKDRRPTRQPKRRI